MKHVIQAAVALLWIVCAGAASAQVTGAEEAPIDAIEASDVAKELALEAAATSVGSSSSRTAGEEKLQQQVDKIAALAATLETEIGAGTDKAETRPIYEDLRRARLEALGLAMSGQVEIAPADGAFFELMIRDLGRYHEPN